MSLKENMRLLSNQADALNKATRSVNLAASKFNGVAAIIPNSVPAPASYFKGCRVILHNVMYDRNIGAVCAVVTFPYIDGDDQEREQSGTTHRFKIDESWFQ